MHLLVLEVRVTNTATSFESNAELSNYMRHQQYGGFFQHDYALIVKTKYETLAYHIQLKFANGLLQLFDRHSRPISSILFDSYPVSIIQL